MSTNPKPIPITLLSGFLGSGKTTLLKYILNENHGYKIAVIINDLASVNIDAKLIENEKNIAIKQQKETIVQLENGCACCTLRSDLVEQLISLSNSGKYDYIIIETSGLSEPMSVAQTFTENYSKKLVSTYMNQLAMMKAGQVSIEEMTSDTKEAYALIEHVIKLGGLNKISELDTAVTVVDAFNFLNNYESFELATTSDGEAMNETKNSSITDLLIQQIEFADVILINKISTIKDSKEKTAEKIMKIINSLNPKAKVYQTDYCKIDDLKLILNTGLFSFDRIRKMSSWIESVEGLVETFGEDKHEEEPDHHDHEHHDHEQHGHDHKAGGCCSDDQDHKSDECCGHGHDHDHDHGNDHIKKYGINSFIYSSSKPFHPGRLDRLLRDKYMLIKQGEFEEEEDEEEEDEEEAAEGKNDAGNVKTIDSNDAGASSGVKRTNSDSSSPSKKVKADIKKESLSPYPDFTVPSHEELVKNKHDSSFKDVIRIKGFIWLATSILSKCELGGSGQLIRFQSSTPWLNQFTLPFMFPLIQDYKEMKAEKSNRSKEGKDEEIDTSNVFLSSEELANLLSETSMPKAKVDEIIGNEFGDASNEIVFIGFNLDKESISKELDSCLLTDDEMKYFKYVVLDKLGLYRAPDGENAKILETIGKPENYFEDLEEYELNYEEEEVDIMEVEDFLYGKFGDDYVPFI